MAVIGYKDLGDGTNAVKVDMDSATFDSDGRQSVTIGALDNDELTTATATIANNGTISSAIVLNGRVPVTLQMPAAFTGTTVTFQSSYDLNTYQAVYDYSGGAVSATVAASHNVSLAGIFQSFLGAKAIKIVSGSAEGGERVITVVMRPLV